MQTPHASSYNSTNKLAQINHRRKAYVLTASQWQLINNPNMTSHIQHHRQQRQQHRPSLRPPLATRRARVTWGHRDRRRNTGQGSVIRRNTGHGSTYREGDSGGHGSTGRSTPWCVQGGRQRRTWQYSAERTSGGSREGDDSP